MANFIPKIIYGDLNTEIVFELPPIEDFRRERVNANARTTVSTGGVEQTQFNYNRETRTVNMTFVSEAITDAFRTFFTSHASRGLSFQYFESEDEVDFITVTLSAKNFRPQPLFPDNTGGFVYEFSFSIIRTL